MFTLHRIRDFTLAVTLGMGALVSTATLACEKPTMVEVRDAAVASLGSMTVTAPRLPATYGSFADLGSMTVTASRADLRVADLRVADLGGMTVQASRIKPVSVAASASNRAFN
ncbi:MAG TPA: hypothetical protein VLD59_05465 [Steroidobacteraceae bacterium]|nr:hypothetical protein [Steroidobacteraceae bacterium]